MNFNLEISNLKIGKAINDKKKYLVPVPKSMNDIGGRPGVVVIWVARFDRQAADSRSVCRGGRVQHRVVRVRHRRHLSHRGLLTQFATGHRSGMNL